MAGLATTIRAGALTSDAVALEARKAAEADRGAGSGSSATPARWAPVTSLTQRRLADLPADTRPVPSVAAYDQLLRHRSAGADPPAQ